MTADAPAPLDLAEETAVDDAQCEGLVTLTDGAVVPCRHKAGWMIWVRCCMESFLACDLHLVAAILSQPELVGARHETTASRAGEVIGCLRLFADPPYDWREL